MPISPLARKLQLRPGQRIALVNARPGTATALAPVPDVSLVARLRTADAVKRLREDLAGL